MFLTMCRVAYTCKQYEMLLPLLTRDVRCIKNCNLHLGEVGSLLGYMRSEANVCWFAWLFALQFVFLS